MNIKLSCPLLFICAMQSAEKQSDVVQRIRNGFQEAARIYCETMSTAEIMRTFARWHRQLLTLHKDNQQLIDQQWQQLAQEVQEEVGIPAEDRVPGKSSTIFKRRADGIYINEEWVDVLTYGQAHLEKLIDAIHLKYHDATGEVVDALLTGFCAAVATTLFEGRFATLLSVTTVTALKIILSTEAINYQNERAKKEAFKTLTCHKCAQELSHRDQKKIDIAKLIEEGHLCRYHQQQQ